MIRNILAVLATLLLWTGSTEAANISVAGSLDGNSPTFNRRTDRDGNPASTNTGMPYAVIPFTTGSIGGTVSATVSIATQFDSFLTLYSSFDPANPQNNILAADDDSGGYPHALLSRSGLAANTSFVLVVTSYSGQADTVFPLYGSYALTISGDVSNNLPINAIASPPAGGTVTCTPSSVVSGGSSTCTASANAGYAFAGFSGDCTGTTCVLSNVTAAKSVTATFALNTAPTATAVTIGGAPQVNVQVTGGYTYADTEADPQGASTFRWMADTQTNGATKVAIAGATSTHYTAAAADEGKYLFFCVTPVAAKGITTGIEVCSAASAAVAPAAVIPPPAPPLIPPMGGPLPGVTGGPVLLNMAGGDGPAIAANVARVLERVVTPGMNYVGQSPDGAVIMSMPGGQHVVFAPIAVQSNDPRADGLYPLGNGQFQIVASGVALTVQPVVQNLPQLLGLLPPGTAVTMGSNGVLVAKVGGLTYVVQPGVFVQLVANPGGVPALVLGADGYLHFTDAAGNSQTLYPAFAEVDVLWRTLKSLDAGATLQIQLDGTAVVRFQNQDLVLVPDLTLGGVPAGQEGSYWWQEGPGRYRVRVQANWFEFLSQGFTVR